MAESPISRMVSDQIKRLTDAGFTHEQAEVLLQIMQEKALMGGFL